MWKKSTNTKVTAKYDVGFGKTLFIRGNGPGLSWDKGTAMKNAGKDVWVWESEASAKEFEFKVLVNDLTYEEGANHRVDGGKSVQFSPKFRQSA